MYAKSTVRYNPSEEELEEAERWALFLEYEETQCEVHEALLCVWERLLLYHGKDGVNERVLDALRDLEYVLADNHVITGTVCDYFDTSGMY